MRAFSSRCAIISLFDGRDIADMHNMGNGGGAVYIRGWQRKRKMGALRDFHACRARASLYAQLFFRAAVYCQEIERCILLLEPADGGDMKNIDMP